MRLFVALSLPEMARTHLSLLGGGVPGATWSPAENLHLTLRFIGEVSTNEARDIDDVLAAIGGHAINVEIAGVGQFGDKKQARVLWAGIRPNPTLVALRDRIERALIGIGLAPESRKFHPHITLARLRNAPVERVGRFLSEHADFTLPAFTADHFTLYSSLRGNQSPVYHPEVEYPLDVHAHAAD
ncbi:MAG: RNA 2',3'-cyclic phosphodiesterase [Alphaproteobacteria bacterium]